MKKAFLIVMTMLTNMYLFAQEKTTKVDVDINKGNSGGGNWYASPWVWIVGVAVFVLLLVALASGSRRDRSDRVVIKKTVRDV